MQPGFDLLIIKQKMIIAHLEMSLNDIIKQYHELSIELERQQKELKRFEEEGKNV